MLRPSCTNLPIVRLARAMWIAGCLVWAGSAAAGVTLHTDPDVGGFVADTVTPDFVADAGTPIFHLDFQTDIDGATLPEDGAVPGDTLALWAVFSSPDAATPELVLATGAEGGTGRIGPSAGFFGTLVIDFAAADTRATAVGFGPVGLGTSATIRFLDAQGGVLLETTDASDSGFTFVGVTTTDGDEIARVEIERPPGAWALQDLSVVVPEPAAGLQALAAIAGVAALRRRVGA